MNTGSQKVCRVSLKYILLSAVLIYDGEITDLRAASIIGADRELTLITA